VSRTEREKNDSDDETFQNFGDIFAEVVSTEEADPILHIVVLTYEFDEEQMLNLIGGRSLDEDGALRRTHLQRLSKIRPIVFFDSRKTKPFVSLPQFLELHPYKVRSYACHHSKAYLIVTQQTVRLVIGSFNLTKTGLFYNREVFESWLWSETETKELKILFDFISLLTGSYATKTKESGATAINELLQSLQMKTQNWSSGNHECQLVSSGYDDQRTGLQQIAEIWRNWFPSSTPSRLLAVSPFFDQVPQHGCVAGDFAAEFPGLGSITVVTDETTRGNLSQSHYGKVSKDKHLFLIPSELSKAERKRISETDKRAVDNLVISRPLHAKILLLESEEGNALAYCGSANFSRKAWKGNNLELGVATKVVDSKAFKQSMYSHLSVNAAQCEFATLPKDAPQLLPKTDDEDYQEDSRFPDFIDYLVLTPTDDGMHVQFKVFASDLEPLVNYDVAWAGHRLIFTAALSQLIPRGEFENSLLSGRTVEFRDKKSPTNAYWFPFQYSGELIAAREVLMHSTARDWFSFYLDLDHEEDSDLGLPLGGKVENGEGSRKSVFDIDRESNCVIAMQTYLNFFSQIERTFTKRLEHIQKVSQPTEPDKAIRNQVTEPLSGLLTLLDRENLGEWPTHLFKIGELKLLVARLRTRVSTTNRLAIDDLINAIDKALCANKCTDSLKPVYLNFLANEVEFPQ